MWTCPNCGAENPFTTPVCQKCDEIRAIVGGATITLPLAKKEPDDGQRIPE